MSLRTHNKISVMQSCSQVYPYYFADHYQTEIKYIFKTPNHCSRGTIYLYSIISIRVYKLRYMRTIHCCHCGCSVFSRHYSSDNTRECIMYCNRIRITKMPKKKTFLNGRQKTHIYAKMSVYYIKITYTFREWIKQTVYHIIIHIHYRITYNTINISIYIIYVCLFRPFFYTLCISYGLFSEIWVSVRMSFVDYTGKVFIIIFFTFFLSFWILKVVNTFYKIRNH